MRLPLPISVSLILLSGQTVRAQPAPADDFFNRGAQFYISNNIPSALEQVETGLKTYPDNVKLKKLEELLKQQQQSQSSQSQQNQNQQSQQKQSQDKQQSQKQNSSGQQNQQNKQDQSGRKNDGQQKQQQQKSGEKTQNQNEQGQPEAAGQMTPEEAKRLLDAQKGNEQVLQLKPQGKPENRNQPIKDW